MLCPDAAGLSKRGIAGVVCTYDTCGSSCLSQEGKPDPASQPRRVRSSGGDRGCNLTIAQKEGAAKLSLAKVIMNVIASNNAERVLGAEPFMQPSSWWHFLPVKVTFASTKDIHLELGLKGLEVLYLGVIVNIKQESINIGKGNPDVSIRFDTVKGVAKG